MSKSTKRIMKEMGNLSKYYPISQVEDSKEWHIDLNGPVESPYFGGTFRLSITFEDYPFSPPIIKFMTRIYHPNVDYHTGKICLACLKSDAWAASMSMEYVIENLMNILIEPDASDPIYIPAADMFINNPQEFTKTAIDHTKRFAMRE